MLYKLVKDTQRNTNTAAISMSCYRHNRNNTRCTWGGRTKQEEATRIQSWSTQAAWKAQGEESSWQTSLGYNPGEHGLTSWQKEWPRQVQREYRNTESIYKEEHVNASCKQSETNDKARTIAQNTNMSSQTHTSRPQLMGPNKHISADLPRASCV